MNIKELKDGDKKVSIEGEITEKGKPREAGGGQVCDFTLRDASGSVKLSLWNEDVDRVKVGSRVKVENGFVKSYRGEIQLGVSKPEWGGKLTVLTGQLPAQAVQNPPAAQNPPRKEEPAKGKALDAYYGSVTDLAEVDLAGANELLKQGWTLEKIEMEHASNETPTGIMHNSVFKYVLSHRTK